MVPFLLKCLILNCSTSAGVVAVKLPISDIICLILSNMVKAFDSIFHGDESFYNRITQTACDAA